METTTAFLLFTICWQMIETTTTAYTLASSLCSACTTNRSSISLTLLCTLLRLALCISPFALLYTWILAIDRSLLRFAIPPNHPPSLSYNPPRRPLPPSPPPLQNKPLTRESRPLLLGGSRQMTATEYGAWKKSVRVVREPLRPNLLSALPPPPSSHFRPDVLPGPDMRRLGPVVVVPISWSFLPEARDYRGPVMEFPRTRLNSGLRFAETRFGEVPF